LDIRSLAELSEYIKRNVLDEDELIECPICSNYIFSDVIPLININIYNYTKKKKKKKKKKINLA